MAARLTRHFELFKISITVVSMLYFKRSLSALFWRRRVKFQNDRSGYFECVPFEYSGYGVQIKTPLLINLLVEISLLIFILFVTFQSNNSPKDVLPEQNKIVLGNLSICARNKNDNWHLTHRHIYIIHMYITKPIEYTRLSKSGCSCEKRV